MTAPSANSRNSADVALRVGRLVAGTIPGRTLMADTEELTSKPSRRAAEARRRKTEKTANPAAARTQQGGRAAAPAAESSGKRTNRRNNFNSKRNRGKETNTDKGTKRQPVRKPTKTPVPIASSVLRRERKKKVRTDPQVNLESTMKLRSSVQLWPDCAN